MGTVPHSSTQPSFLWKAGALQPTVASRRLWRFFGKEQVLVLRQEDLRRCPQTCLERIWRHLSIAQGPDITPLERHNGDYNSPMTPACRERLRHIFWQEIGQLEQLLGWDCSDWLRS